MTYEEALREIGSHLIFGSKLGLERISALLELLGSPHKKLKFIHVAGTNGKGTTCAYMASVLTAAGCRTGLYTSPYVVDFRERFCIDGQMIGEQELADLVAEIAPLAAGLDQPITEFEFITALGLVWFCRRSCDIVVLEVGLGGRFDATNVIGTPEMAVITAISLDHTEILGDTLEKIAFEKGGIIKGGGRVVLYPDQQPQAESAIKALCCQRGARLIMPPDDIAVLQEGLEGSRVRYGSRVLDLPFSGRHQVLNGATALAALENLPGFTIPEQAYRAGFASARMAARMEILSHAPLILLDGGHNPGCAAALKDLLQRHLPGRKITAVMGMMRDKDSHGYLAAVAPLFSAIVTVAPDNPRAMTAAELAEAAGEFCGRCVAAESMGQAADLALDMCEDVLVACGSLFLAGEIRGLLLNNTR